LNKSKELFSKAKKIIPSGVNSPVRYFEPYPFFVTKSQSGHIWDADGNSLVDLCNGYGALLLGHNKREIISAVLKQLAQGTLYCAPTPQEIELSKLIIGNFPSMDRVRLVNTGSEATMTAIRLARGFTKKKKIIKFEGCYHGAHDSVLVKAGSGQAHNGIAISDGVLHDTSKHTLVSQYNDFTQLENIIQKNKDDIAGLIIEPVLANMGLVLPEKNFLRNVRKITKDNDIPLIFDEIVTGFRMSTGGAQQYYKIKPDITTLAKALSNGFTIAAIGGKKEIMDNLAPNGNVYQASTFAGNPIATTAAIASIHTMNKLKKTLYPKLEKNCTKLANLINDIATDMSIPHQVNSISSMLQIFFTDKPVTDSTSAKKADVKKFQKMFQTLLQNHIFIAPSQFETMFLSNAHSETDMIKIYNAFHTSLLVVKCC
jgi:glutamate-1-semialdehyde 2,1-aminomutase